MTTSIERLSNDDLRNIATFDDAMALFNGDVHTADSELGDGFELLKEKDRLIGDPCLFISWSFSEGDHGEFVSARVIAKSGGKYVVNDGSTGLCSQLREYTDSHGGRNGGLLSRRGLRKSEYTYDETDPKTGEIKTKPAVTYYIDTSA